MKYRKKQVVIDAIQWTGKNEDELFAFSGKNEEWLFFYDGVVKIPTLEGEHFGLIGDFIIKGVAGEFYPCKPDIFAATYEKVNNLIRVKGEYNE